MISVEALGFSGVGFGFRWAFGIMQPATTVDHSKVSGLGFRV